MKILAIDSDQRMLLFIEKHFIKLGYEVITAQAANEANSLFDLHMPNIILVNLNMPGMAGLEVLRHIRFKVGSTTPILIMLENSFEQVFQDNFNIGIDYYMKKPFSLEELSRKVEEIIGKPVEATVPSKNMLKANVLHRDCVGVIIPCYNTEERLLSKEFSELQFNELGYNLCFINEGSTDDTLILLQNLQKKYPEIIKVIDISDNSDKENAVCKGVNCLLNDSKFEYIGFLDADISADLLDYVDLVKIIKNSDFKIVNGYRISKMKPGLTTNSARKIISATVNIIMQTVLNVPFAEQPTSALS